MPKIARVGLPAWSGFGFMGEMSMVVEWRVRVVAGLATLFAAMAVPFGLGTAAAAEIKVLTTTNMMPILERLAGSFESSSGHKVKFEHGGAAPIQKRIQSGEFADVAIHSRSALDQLAKESRIKSGSVVDIAHIPVGLAVRAGAARPDVSSVEAFKRALLAAGSIAYPNPAGGSLGGIYAAELAERLGIAAEIKSKVKLTGAATAAAELVAKGGADLVIDQLVQLRQVQGLDIVLPLPAELTPQIAMSAGVPASVHEADAAMALIRFLTSPAAAEVVKAQGMVP